MSITAMGLRYVPLFDPQKAYAHIYGVTVPEVGLGVGIGLECKVS